MTSNAIDPCAVSGSCTLVAPGRAGVKVHHVFLIKGSNTKVSKLEVSKF